MTLETHMVEYYKNLSEVLENRDVLTKPLIKLEEGKDYPAPDKKIHVATYSHKQLASQINHLLPSQAITVVMYEIENAIRVKCARQATLNKLSNLPNHDESEVAKRIEELSQEVEKLQFEITAAVNWFNADFLPQLHAEIDAEYYSRFNIQTIDQTFLEDLKPILGRWHQVIDEMAGDDLSLAVEQDKIYDLDFHMVRVKAAHERMADATQSLWLAENAQEALTEMRGKVARLDTAGSIRGEAAQLEYQKLYQRFQHYITTKMVEEIDNPAQVDHSICLALNGQDTKGAKLKPGLTEARSISNSLAGLSLFTDGNYSQQLIDRISTDLTYYRELASYQLSERDTARNTDPLNELLNQLDNPNLIDWETLELTQSQHQLNTAFDLVITEDLDLTALFTQLKSLATINNDIEASLIVLKTLQDMIGKYNSLPRSELNDADLLKMQNCFAILVKFFSADDIDPTLFDDFRNYLNNQSPSNRHFGNHFTTRFTAFSEALAAKKQQALELKTTIETTLKKDYEDALHRSPLKESTRQTVLQVKQIDEAFQQQWQSLDANLKFALFDNSPKIVTEELTQALQSVFDADDTIEEKWLASRYCSELTHHTLIAREASKQFKYAAQLIEENQQLTDNRLIKANIDIIGAILNNFENVADIVREKMPVAADQLQQFVALLDTYAPFQGSDLQENPISEIHIPPQLESFFSTVNKPFLSQLAVDPTTLAFDGVDQTFMNSFALLLTAQAPANDNVLEDFLAATSKLLAHATRFEIANTLKVGSLTEPMYEKLSQRYFELREQQSLAVQYDADKTAGTITRAEQYLDENLLTPNADEIKQLKEDQSNLTALLKAMETQNGFYFVESSRLPLGLFSIPIPALNLPQAKNYLQAERATSELYIKHHHLLNTAKYDANFLNKAHFQGDLADMIRTCKVRLATIAQTLSEQEYYQSQREALRPFYRHQAEHFESQQTQSTEEILYKLGSKIIAEKFEPQIRRAADLLTLEREDYIEKTLQHMNKQVEACIEIIKQNKDGAYTDKDSKAIQQFLIEKLRETYALQMSEARYYARLGNAQILIQEFERYLSSPGWMIESKKTTRDKRRCLQALQNIIEDKSKTMQERFDAFAAKFKGSGNIDGLEDGGELRKTLEKDIDPKLTDVLQFIAYWFMKFARLVFHGLTVGRTPESTKDDLAEKLYNTSVIGETTDADEQVLAVLDNEEGEDEIEQAANTQPVVANIARAEPQKLQTIVKTAMHFGFFKKTPEIKPAPALEDDAKTEQRTDTPQVTPAAI